MSLSRAAYRFFSDKMALPMHLKIATISGSIALFGILFGWVIFPKVLKSQLKKSMTLDKKNEIRDMWEKVPFAINFSVYLFNYTNPEEVQSGGKPIVQQIGPYAFDEWKEKVDIKDNDVDDTVSFRKMDTYYFRQDLSGSGLTGNETIIMPHLFILGMGTMVAKERPTMLKLIDKAIDGIFDTPSDVFMRAKAMDILFNGVNINCDRNDFAPKAVCVGIKKENVSGITFGPNNQYKFSLFGAKNKTPDAFVTKVKKGTSNVNEVGTVIEVDGVKKPNYWKGSCNQYKGTDGTIFRPLIDRMDLYTYSPELCRFIKAYFVKKSKYAGLNTNIYTLNIGDLTDPELTCLCDDKCPPKGLMELTKCVKAPLFISAPHYLSCDKSLLNNIVGLNPDPKNHSIELHFEPTIGKPLVANSRVQMSIQLFQTEKVRLLKDLSNYIVPLFWIEESVYLDKKFTGRLKKQLFLPKRIMKYLTWIMFLGGTATALVALFIYYNGAKYDIPKVKKSKEEKVTRVQPDKIKDEDRVF